MQRTRSRSGLVRHASRWALAGFMLAAGMTHFLATDEFLGQLPTWLPLRVPIVWLSGAIEIGFAVSLVVLVDRRRQVGWGLAVLFVLVFPANLYQAIAGTTSFGLDSPAERWGRLLAQPLLIGWALWSTDEEPG